MKDKDKIFYSFLLIALIFCLLLFLIYKPSPEIKPDPDKPSLKSVTVYTEHEIQRKGAENIHINIIVIKNHEYIIFDTINGIDAVHSASCPCYKK